VSLFLVPKLESLCDKHHTQFKSLHLMALDSPNHHTGSVLGNAHGSKAPLCRSKHEAELGDEGKKDRRGVVLENNRNPVFPFLLEQRRKFAFFLLETRRIKYPLNTAHQISAVRRRSAERTRMSFLIKSTFAFLQT